MTDTPPAGGRLIRPDPKRSIALGTVVTGVKAAILVVDLGYTGDDAGARTRTAMTAIAASGLRHISGFDEVFPAAFGWSYTYRPNSHNITLRADGHNRRIVYSGDCYDAAGTGGALKPMPKPSYWSSQTSRS